MRPWVPVIALVLSGCQASPSPNPGSADPGTASTAAATDPGSESSTPASDPGTASTTAAADRGSESLEVPAKINARYAEQTNPGRWAAQFEREGREVHDRRADIITALALPPTADVADIGAGTGLFTLDFARAVPEGSVVAVDVQSYFLEHIAAKATDAGLGNVRTVLASQTSVELAPNSIDVAFFCDAFHHVEQPTAYLESVLAALRPGGHLIIIDYDRTRPGTKAWMKEHIRADPAAFRAEIEAAGFGFGVSLDMLEENFFYTFRKPQ